MSVRKFIRSLSKTARQEAEAPDFYKEYALLFEESGPQKEDLLMDMTYAVIDTEATGLDHDVDEIVSFGGVVLRDFTISIEESISIYFAGRNVTDRKALEIHGLLPNEENAEEELTGLKKILQFAGNKILVGHFLGFDIRMIYALLAKYQCPPLKNMVMDTSEFAKRLDFPLRNYQFAVHKQYTLDALCARFGVIPKARHTAAGDAYITAILFQKLLYEFRSKGILYFKDINK